MLYPRRRGHGLTRLLPLLALFGLACASDAPGRRYTFSWPLDEASTRAPRGGTTTGPEPRTAAVPHAGWTALQEPGLDAFERDRRAILAMAGPHRVRFDFLETYALLPDAPPLDVPYQSWATEFVYVVEDRGDFISLQHVMVMFFEIEGETVGPHVTKHWRQDWTYEDRDLHVFRGHGVWERYVPSEAEARGAWSQAVYQVDDSPRYEALGRWHHDGNHSVWESERTWRPLPRREFSVRDDYHALVGTNRHVITPEGWIHEQANTKRVVDADGGAPRHLSRELGLNRYERIEGHDFSAGDTYWEETGPYWEAVRAAWRERFANHDRLRVAGRVEGVPLFARHFESASALAEGELAPEDAPATVDAILVDYVSPDD